MKHVKKSVLIWHSPRQMYALVTAVEDYPKFLPWCERAEVMEHRDDGVTARLFLGFAGVHHAFTTRNTHTPDAGVSLSLVDGPFSKLDGHWRFEPLPPEDGAAAAACRIEFELAYAFSSLALELLISPVFDRIANTFVDSFVKRAEQVYGSQ